MLHFDRLSAGILGGGGDLLFGCEVGKVLSNFRNAYFFWVAFDIRRAQSRVMKEDVVFYPEDVGIFGTRGVVPQGDAARCLMRRTSRYWSSSFLSCGADVPKGDVFF